MTTFELVKQVASDFTQSGEKMLSTDELNALIDSASSKEEVDFYSQLYNYLLARKQQRVIQNGQY